MSILSDEELMAQAQRGSESHFNLLVDRHTPAVYRLALEITRNHHEAEDIVQETFLKVYGNLRQYSPDKARFKTWLFTIARNQSINVFRSLKRKTARLFFEYDFAEQAVEPGAGYASPENRNAEQMLSQRQETARIQGALGKLPERQRTALLLKSQEELSYDEIASVMKTSVSSVESLIFRARKRLLELLE